MEDGLFVEASALLLAALDGVEVLGHHQEQVVRQHLRAHPVLAQVTWYRWCWITMVVGFIKLNIKEKCINTPSMTRLVILFMQHTLVDGDDVSAAVGPLAGAALGDARELVPVRPAALARLELVEHQEHHNVAANSATRNVVCAICIIKPQ